MKSHKTFTSDAAFNYAAFPAADGKKAGWRIGQMVGNFEDIDVNDLVQFIPTSLASERQLPRYASAADKLEFIHRTAWMQFRDHWLLVHSAPAGKDASGRTGNVYSTVHIFKHPDRQLVWPCEIMGAQELAEPYNAEINSARVENLQLTPRPVDDPRFSAAPGQVFANLFSRREGKAPVSLATLAYVLDSVATGTPVSVAADSTRAHLWIAALNFCSAPNRARNLTFSTHETAATLGRGLGADRQPANFSLAKPMFSVIPHGAADAVRALSMQMTVIDEDEPVTRGPGNDEVLASRWGDMLLKLVRTAADAEKLNSVIIEDARRQEEHIAAILLSNLDPERLDSEDPEVIELLGACVAEAVPDSEFEQYYASLPQPVRDRIDAARPVATPAAPSTPFDEPAGTASPFEETAATPAPSAFDNPFAAARAAAHASPLGESTLWETAPAEPALADAPAPQPEPAAPAPAPVADALTVTVPRPTSEQVAILRALATEMDVGPRQIGGYKTRGSESPLTIAEYIELMMLNPADVEEDARSGIVACHAAAAADRITATGILGWHIADFIQWRRLLDWTPEDRHKFEEWVEELLMRWTENDEPRGNQLHEVNTHGTLVAPLAELGLAEVIRKVCDRLARTGYGPITQA